MNGAPAARWRLSPSDFSFLWEECRRCFYLKVVREFPRPRMMMPRIFTTIDTKMKEFYAGKRTEALQADLPPGVIETGDRWLLSTPIRPPGRGSACILRGKLDAIIHFEDGAHGVIDFKTSERRSEHIPRYARQLHAYAYALEHNAPGEFGLAPISTLGLLVFEPNLYTQGQTGRVGFAGEARWYGIARDDAAFLAFLDEVLAVLEQPEPPPPGPECEWCQYRARSRGMSA